MGSHTDTISITTFLTKNALIGLHYTGHLGHDVAIGPWRTALIDVWSILRPCDFRTYFLQRLRRPAYNLALFDGTCSPRVEIGIFELCLCHRASSSSAKENSAKLFLEECHYVLYYYLRLARIIASYQSLKPMESMFSSLMTRRIICSRLPQYRLQSTCPFMPLTRPTSVYCQKSHRPVYSR